MTEFVAAPLEYYLLTWWEVAAVCYQKAMQLG